MSTLEHTDRFNPTIMNKDARNEDTSMYRIDLR